MAFAFQGEAMEDPQEAEKKRKEKDIAVHTRWAIDQRANVQHTLLALYEHLKVHNPNIEPWPRTSVIDDLIAAAFSLWRAVFLAESERLFDSIQKAQSDFLSKLLTTNAITFSDDHKNRAWAFGYYLQAAMHRLKSAKSTVSDSLEPEADMELERYLTIHVLNDSTGNRYQWEQLHATTRIIFRMVAPEQPLMVEPPKPIPGHPFYS